MNIRRTRKLINSPLQLKLSLWIVGVATLVMMIQFVFMAMAVSKIGPLLPNDSQVFFESFFEVMVRSFLASLAVALSVTFVAGVLLTHRIAGPLYRFTSFLNAVNRGDQPDECAVRKNDELKNFRELLNVTTEPLRRHVPHGDQTEETPARAA
ncbi:MAG: signal transduction histidine kinase [Planctomycetota bacterium]|jgi:signal transduction histidine kinase